MIFPGTRKPRSLCTRAATVPVKLRLAVSGVLTFVTLTSGAKLRGSAACAFVSVDGIRKIAAPTPMRAAIATVESRIFCFMALAFLMAIT
ncbi:hypothetical protein D3C86_1612010 [compost metagenome]